MLAGANYAGTYNAGAGWDRPVAGMVAAVGPADWLVVTCLRSTGIAAMRSPTPRPEPRAVLPGLAVPGYFYSTWPPVGVTSPDGTTAAVPEASRTGAVTLHLISLRSGTDRGLTVPLRSVPLAQSMVWSPDSRWLFAATADGRIVAVNARSGRAETLGTGLAAGRAAGDQVRARQPGAVTAAASGDARADSELAVSGSAGGRRARGWPASGAAAPGEVSLTTSGTGGSAAHRRIWPRVRAKDLKCQAMIESRENA